MSSLGSNPPVPAPSTTRSRRLSRFIEGETLSGADILQQQPRSNELLVNILSEMDEFEKKRKHSHYSSSVTSLSSSNASPTSAKSPIVGNVRKSFSLLRSSLDEKERVWFSRPSLDERDSRDERDGLQLGREKFSQKFKGRLRAWTGGKDRETKAQAYAGV